MTGPVRLLAGAWRTRVVALLAVAAQASVAAAANPGAGPDVSTALRASQAAIGQLLDDHAVTDQDGRPLQLADLRGRPLVLTFIFTNCLYVCSGSTLHLREVVRIAREALGPSSFSVLTIGFDTAHDTPQRMRTFGRDRGIDDPEWRFASADSATIHRLTGQAGFTWAASSAGFDHVTQVTIVDGTGRVVQQVYGPEFAPPALVEPLRRLVLQQSLDRPNLRGLIDSLRLFCSAYDPTTGRYRVDYSMFAGALPVVLVLGMVAIAIVLGSRRRH